ncbi:MAG: hypothetical protein KGS72_28125 [Cyanobacteria bacterium REEB67]|nr:hypothetical protein [Cyanobacteria bacterium REEB67]
MASPATSAIGHDLISHALCKCIFALLISAYLSNGTVFDLLDYVKKDPNRRKMPFVNFSCSEIDLAKSVDGSLRSTAMLLGADKCISQEVFNAAELRSEIESVLLGRNKAVKMEDSAS